MLRCYNANVQILTLAQGMRNPDSSLEKRVERARKALEASSLRRDRDKRIKKLPRKAARRGSAYSSA